MINQKIESTEYFLQAVGDVCWEWDITAEKLSYSQGLITLLGLKDSFPSEISITRLKDFICTYDYRQFIDAVDAYTDHKTDVFSYDLRLRCGDGSEKWFRARGKAVEWDEDSLPMRMVGTLADIDREKRNAIALNLSQSRYQAISEDGTVMICRFTCDFNLTYINCTLCEFLGHPESILLGKSLLSYIHPSEKEYILGQLQNESSVGQIADFEARVLSCDGKFHWLRWRTHLITDPVNSIVEYQAVGQDVTEIHNKLDLYHARVDFDRMMAGQISRITSYQAEDLDELISQTLAELGHSLKLDRAFLFIFDFAQERVSEIHEWCANGMLEQKENMQNLSFNQFTWWTKMLKTGESIIINQLDDLPTEVFSEKDFLRNQEVKSVCLVPLATQGKPIGVLSFAYIREARPWDEHTPVLLAILAEAIANAIEGNKTNRLIQMNEARERLFIDAIPALIVRIDSHGRVLDYATGCHGILSQYVALHASNQVNSLDDLFERSIADEIFKKLAFTSENKANKEYEFEINVAGKPTTLEMKYSVSTHNENILVFQDISEKKNLERLKNDFISNATHEMRTPLTTILLMIDLMEKTDESAKKDEYWQILKGEVNRERMLIEDLLTISRIEKGKFSGAQKQIEVRTAVHDAVTAILPQARGNGIRINEQLVARPVYITGDNNSCQMIFSNLLSNAIKFSPSKGNIDVNVSQEADRVFISISDHGIGIPQEDLARIFERFYRGKNAVSGEIQGSGMGLYIVEHLSNDMGGTVSVNSIVGKGTRFTLEFPVAVLERTVI
jgi:PAS domain S-box-containing protein